MVGKIETFSLKVGMGASLITHLELAVHVAAYLHYPL
jgi:hypothetical protein